jgi:hypothetical protein
MEKIFFLSESCENYILKNQPLIVAAFPSVIVFGEIENCSKFKELKYFKFKSFESRLLLKTIEAVVLFFHDNNAKLSKLSFFSDSSNKLDYFWQGNCSEHKTVTFSIESNKSETFSITFSLEDLNNLIYLIKRCLLASLCLKDIEELFFLELIKLTEDQIVLCQRNNNIASEIVCSFFKDQEIVKHFKLSPFTNLIIYYNDIILILKDFSSLWYNENESD